MGLTEQTGQLINPKTVAKEEDIPGAIVLWEERRSRLARHGADCTLPAAYKKVALKKILTGKVRETFELWEAENCHSKICQGEPRTWRGHVNSIMTLPRADQVS